MSTPASLLYPDWPRHNARLRDAVRTLPEETLALRASPDHGTVWQLAAHVAGARAFWLCGWFGEPGADRTPFPTPLDGIGWEDDEAHPRTGDELAWALDSTFAIVQDCLTRWSVDVLAVVVGREVEGALREHSRASVLDRLITHEAFHAGEISQLLGTQGLPGIDLWRRDPA